MPQPPNVIQGMRSPERYPDRQQGRPDNSSDSRRAVAPEDKSLPSTEPPKKTVRRFQSEIAQHRIQYLTTPDRITAEGYRVQGDTRALLFVDCFLSIEVFPEGDTSPEAVDSRLKLEAIERYMATHADVWDVDKRRAADKKRRVDELIDLVKGDPEAPQIIERLQQDMKASAFKMPAPAAPTAP